MRFFLYKLLALTAAASALAAAPEADAKGDTQHAVVSTPEGSDGLDDVVPDTVFNGETVPPIKELSADSFDADTSKGYW